MIVVKINNLDVDLPESAEIPISLVSPYLLYDNIPSNSIKLPSFIGSPRNMKIFGYSHEPQSTGIMPEYGVSVFASGELIREGFFRLTEAGEGKGYNGLFTEKLEEFFGEYQDTLLEQILLGSVVMPGVLPATPLQISGMNAVCFPVVNNPDYYGTSPGSYTGKMNDHNGTAFETNSPRVPMVFVKYVIAKLAELSGVTITGSFLTNAEYQNLLFFNTRSMDGAATLEVNKYVPSMTVEQLFLELRKLPNLAFLFNANERTLKMEFWEDKLSAATEIDWSSKVEGDGVKVMEQNTRLQLSYELDGGDALMKDKPLETSEYVTPQYAGQTFIGLAKISSKFSTLLVDAAGLVTCKQTGITAVNNQLTAKYSPRLLFWRGLVAGKPTALPTGSNGGTLYWNGPNGLKARHWSKMEELRAKQFYLKQKIMLNECDLSALDFSKKVHIQGVDYLIAQVDVSLPISKPADVLLVGGM